MSKILVVSDSHGMTKELGALKERHQHEVDLMIHCGDSQLMADDNGMAGFAAVRGNCDYDSRYPAERLEEIAGKKVFVTHGHKYSVKTSLMSLYYRAKEVQADIVCFGHSHVLGAEMIDGILFLNPGSIRLPRERHEKTYVILDLLEEKIQLSVFSLNGREIQELSRDFGLANS
jgi:putative phosphoesterase